MEKVTKMKQKFDLVHEHFQIPTTETIIQGEDHPDGDKLGSKELWLNLFH
jgi:hypothetical protein